MSAILRGREIICASVLIAAKMRERDIECPTLSVISKAGRTYYSKLGLITMVTEIKNAEIQINNRFDWNFAFRTPYDFIETFLSIGIILESDTLNHNSTNISPMSDLRLNENDEVRSKYPLDRSPNARKSYTAGYQDLKHMATPSTNHGPIQIGGLDIKYQTELRRKLRDTCLEVVDYLSLTSLCSPRLHKELAYAVVMYSRKIHNISDIE